MALCNHANIPQSTAEPIVVIHNDARDFEDFLWFIHVE